MENGSVVWERTYRSALPIILPIRFNRHLMAVTLSVEDVKLGRSEAMTGGSVNSVLPEA
jgi:hypothetical protein